MQRDGDGLGNGRQAHLASGLPPAESICEGQDRRLLDMGLAGDQTSGIMMLLQVMQSSLVHKLRSLFTTQLTRLRGVT